MAVSVSGMQSPINSGLAKLIDQSSVVNGLIYSAGAFYEYVKFKSYDAVVASSSGSGDDSHACSLTGESLASFGEWSKRSEPHNESDIFSALASFPPGSVDPERLFSFGRLSKNLLQCRLKPENHARNVFINKTKAIL